MDPHEELDYLLWMFLAGVASLGYVAYVEWLA